MMKSLIRYAVSVLLGLAIALPFVRLPLVQAAQLEAEDLLSSDFGDSTGLGQSDLQSTIGSLINVALTFLGVVAVVIILLGGFKWMTAGGNDEKVGEAKRLIVAGIIGMAIILSAYAIASFVISSIVGATAG
jgi:Zn-dependent protease with chaperone function